MKKIVFSGTMMLLTVSLFAQPQKQNGPPNPPPIAERWKRDSIKLQLYVNLGEEQVSRIKNAFVSFYTGLDALAPKAEMNLPRKEDIDHLLQTRNDAVKNIMDAKQFDRFTTFEREFMPLHPPMPGNKKMPPPQL